MLRRRLRKKVRGSILRDVRLIRKEGMAGGYHRRRPGKKTDAFRGDRLERSNDHHHLQPQPSCPTIQR
jgi:hypothetical protein